jgi:UDP-2-acetamido-2-deoxy-ribo-hexuluronate aminotransferase
MYNFEDIHRIAKDYGMYVIEDGCHSLGSSVGLLKSLSLTDYAFTSFYPTKPLGCFGDGGMIFLKNGEKAQHDYSKLIKMRSHSQTQKNWCEELGYNARLDTIQAAVLMEKYEQYSSALLRRREIAGRYKREIDLNMYGIQDCDIYNSTWALFSLVVREIAHKSPATMALAKKGFPTEVYYKHPLHKLPVFRGDLVKHSYKRSEELCERIFQIPMNEYLTDTEVTNIIETLNEAI